jgi:hypothetical protein
MLAAARFPWLLQTASRNIIEPTVIKAPKSPVFDSPVTEIGSAMGAMQPQKSRTLLIVAE